MRDEELKKKVAEEVSPEELAELWLSAIDTLGMLLLFDVPVPLSVSKKMHQTLTKQHEAWSKWSPSLRGLFSGGPAIIAERGKWQQ